MHALAATQDGWSAWTLLGGILGGGVFGGAVAWISLHVPRHPKL